MRVISGQCHCGNINYEFDWPGEEPLIPVRACQCTYCQKHGAVWTSHPHGRLELRVGDPTNVHHYQFGHHTATFHICAVCGIVVVASSEMDDAIYAVVNVNTFENVESDAFDSEVTDFEGEGESERLARRRQRWTPTQITSQAAS